MYEFIKDNVVSSQSQNMPINITTVSFIADGEQTNFSVGTNIGTLFSVSMNGIGQIRDLSFTFINFTSTITFIEPPIKNSVITVQFYKGTNSVILDNKGKLLQFEKEEFIYTSSRVFNLSNSINSLITVETNGLAEEDSIGFEITGDKEITYNNDSNPIMGSKISISYLY
jgi:hypothetical protein